MSHKCELPPTAVVRAYRNGRTLRQLAKRHGCSHQTIANVLAANGVERRGRGRSRNGDPSGRCIIGGYLYVRDRSGVQALVHRACWESAHGLVSPGRIVHHIDGNPLNNVPENLDCMSLGEHSSLHARLRREGR